MATEDPTEETWKAVVGWEGFYEVSNLGGVRSVRRIVPHPIYGSKLAPSCTLKPNAQKGYLHVILHREGRGSIALVHRLVLAAFDRPPRDGEECNHINFDRGDNRIGNLEWVSRIENYHHSATAGRRSPLKGMLHGMCKLTEHDVLEMRAMHASGISQKDIAAAYGVGISQANRIVRKLSWTHLA